MSATLRPRFRLVVDMGADAVMQLFEERKEAGSLPCRLHLYEHQVEFSVLKKHQHFWSPFLNLVLEADESGCCLQGKYGPNVNLWTMFMAAYAVLFISGSVALVFAYSQAVIGEETTGFAIAGGCAALFALVYAAGRVGRQLAHPQMLEFHHFVETLFGEHILQLTDDEAD